MDNPNYILKFNEGVLTPKDESATKKIAKVLLVVCGIGLITGWLRDSLLTWCCFIFAIVFLFKHGGDVKVPTPCELWFYDDYLVRYCERIYYEKTNIRKEYEKFYYKDIKRCLYRTVSKKITITGNMESTYYKYNEDGKVNETPFVDHSLVYGGITVFYINFEPDIDFVKEIEEHSPIKVEFAEN